jgi:hypothetical protein
LGFQSHVGYLLRLFGLRFLWLGWLIGNICFEIFIEINSYSSYFFTNAKRHERKTAAVAMVLVTVAEVRAAVRAAEAMAVAAMAAAAMDSPAIIDGAAMIDGAAKTRRRNNRRRRKKTAPQDGAAKRRRAKKTAPQRDGAAILDAPQY